MAVIISLIYLIWISLTHAEKPHIVVILADDLGWNDVSFHGSNQIPTPNIDALAYNGIILNNHYVQPLCTPSRTAFMTGKYPLRIGMQHSVILEPEPRGLPLEEKLLPAYLKDVGYSTYAVGKWHLGFFRSEYTPVNRGFDSHYGYWNGLQDYYTHETSSTFQPQMKGFDMRRNNLVEYADAGKYTTTLLTEEATKLIENHNSSKPMFMYLAHLAPHTGNMDNPLQAPDELIAKFSHITDPERRVYAAMVSALDDSVGEVVSALRRKGILENTIILFMSDNGAPTFGIHSNRGSNYPLRGQKESPWEGASRGAAAIWSPFFKNMNKVSNELIHISDWLPTFFEAAGKNPKMLDIDGMSMWKSLTEGTASPRRDVILNIDPISQYASLRMGDWKYVNGTTMNGIYDHWFGESGESDQADYNPADILASKASVAIFGAITEIQMKEKRKGLEKFSIQALKSDDINILRQNSIVKCTNKSDAFPCDPLTKPCLFNLKDDPCEMVNLADVRPLQLKTLENLLSKYQNLSREPSNVPADDKADPKFYNGTWVSWQDEKPAQDFKLPTEVIVVVILVLFVLVYVLVLGIGMKFCKSWLSERCIFCGTCKNKSGNNRRYNVKDSNVIQIPTISVSQRVEMFEEKNHLRTLAS